MWQSLVSPGNTILQTSMQHYSCYPLTAVFGAYLQYGSTRLSDSPNVTLTPGRHETLFCLQLTGPVPITIQWYNPDGDLVSGNSGHAVHQFIVGQGRAAYLNFRSYSPSHRGRYECRVLHRNNRMEISRVCIGESCALLVAHRCVRFDVYRYAHIIYVYICITGCLSSFFYL